MRATEFEHEATKVSRTLGRDHGIQIIFKGEDAYTNGKTITLPAMPPSHDLTPTQVAIARGYTDHETAHVIYTDFEAIAAAYNQNQSALFQHTVNCLEDVRIERLYRAAYPGSANNIATTADYVNNEYLSSLPPPETRADVRAIGPVSITWEGRRRDGIAVSSSERCLATIPPELRAKTRKWVDALDHCNSTKDVLDLAAAIVREIEQQERSANQSQRRGDHPQGSDQPEQRPQQNGGQSQQDGDQQKDGPPQDGNGQSQQKDGPPQDGSGQSQQKDGDQPGDGQPGTDDGKDGDRSAKGAGEGGGDQPQPISAAINIKKALGIPDAATNTDEWIPYTRAHDKTYTQAELRSDGADAYNRIAKRMSGGVATMRARLQRALMGTDVRGWQGGFTEGYLDPRALAQAAQAKEHVWRRRSQDKSIRAAVTLLVDASGSMAGTEMHCACEAAIALAEALDVPGVVTSIMTFQNSGEIETVDKSYLWSRCCPVYLRIFKDFDHSLRSSRRYIGAMPSYCNGGTPTGDAMLEAWVRLRKRPEDRKILLVITDGSPNTTPKGRSHHHRFIRQVISEVERDRNNAVLAIGIQCDTVHYIFPKSVVIHDATELSGQVVDQIARALIGRSVKVAA